MEIEFAHLILGVVSAAGGAGGAWGATRQKIKHLEQGQAESKAALTAHDQRTASVGERLARIEALLEQIDKRIH